MRNKPSDFISDAEKMRDFIGLSKEEFLASYSYLTEAEYELTRLKVLEQMSPDTLVSVDIYLDTVTKYTPEMKDGILGDDRDNLLTVDFPLSIVKAWYDEHKEDLSDNPCFPSTTFEEWLVACYTCDDTDGLYEFAVDRGFEPEVPMPRKYKVQFSATYEVWAMDECEAVEIAERNGGSTDCYIYIDGNLWS